MQCIYTYYNATVLKDKHNILFYIYTYIVYALILFRILLPNSQFKIRLVIAFKTYSILFIWFHFIRFALDLFSSCLPFSKYNLIKIEKQL